MSKPSHRASIFVEEAELLEHHAYSGDQYVMRLAAPRCAEKALAGSFVHLSCDPQRPMRRPLSIMRTNPSEGWIEILYKAVGEGTRLLAKRKVGEHINIMGPIGTPFGIDPEHRRPLLIGGGVGMPPMIFIADTLRQQGGFEPLVLLGSEVPFPFQLGHSDQVLPGIDSTTDAVMPLLEGWGIASRLASQQAYQGCHRGFITELARNYLDGLSAEQRAQVIIYSCGPHPMLEAVAAVAREYGLPCQVSMEEFMACGVGGCAGCAIEVQTPDGPAMKRVCVDGPVFDAEALFSA